MTKLPIAIAVTATVIFTAACDRNQIRREARDVEEAREDLREEQRDRREAVEEAKTELEEAKAELAVEVQRQINDLEERYLEIEKDSVTATSRLQAEGRTQQLSEIEDARKLARTRIDEARQAKTPEEARAAIAAAEQALEAFDRRVDQHGNV